MSLHKDDYEQKAKDGWNWLVEWSHGHTFTAGCISGALGLAFLWPLVKAILFK